MVHTPCGAGGKPIRWSGILQGPARESKLDGMTSRKSNSTCVWVLVNPRSGLRWSFDRMRVAMDTYWERPGTEVVYQFCQNPGDGVEKARRAVAAGADTILVAGGDGTVNSIGRALIGTPVALGIIPVGSGNGFARHFAIPLDPARAVEALSQGRVQCVDVGVVGQHPFLVTCSMAWEAAVARTFAAMPVRGILPYVFAGMQELFDYAPQDLTIELDGGRELTFREPMIFTVANLSQYGGGARIAPDASSDDGMLELVVALRQDIAVLIANIGRLFDGTLASMPEVATHRFRTLVVKRSHASPIQVDGELVDAERTVTVGLHASTLNVLVPVKEAAAG
jgi:diacylglycerol kinase (ATP)